MLAALPILSFTQSLRVVIDAWHRVGSSLPTHSAITGHLVQYACMHVLRFGGRQSLPMSVSRVLKHQQQLGDVDAIRLRLQLTDCR
jgi:hypothetical protein